MKISMYLGPSKYWWAYLGIRSNPSLLSQVSRPPGRAVFFDDPRLLPPLDAASGEQAIKYFHVFWDGIGDPREIDAIKQSLGPGADLTVLVVGGFSQGVQEGWTVQALYPAGAMSFNMSPLHFDRRTGAILLGARVKAWLMPLKNILQRKGSAWPMIELLLGRKKIVFCGSYGTIPMVMEQLCARHGIDPRKLDGYEYYRDAPNPSFASYRSTLRSDGLFLARLYDSSDINATFFLSAMALLGREYFIERIRAAGLDLFVNGYGSGINLNVYTTPFYSQHLFVDFGSVVGAGNYPRLADLRYFKKEVVEIGLTGELEELLALARGGAIEQHFEREWELKSRQLEQSMDRLT